MLQADGRLSNTEVARSLEIMETTVPGGAFSCTDRNWRRIEDMGSGARSARQGAGGRLWCWPRGVNGLVVGWCGTLAGVWGNVASGASGHLAHGPAACAGAPMVAGW
jgi:hypothetical protein